MNRRIKPALKTIRLPKSRVMSNPFPTTSHCYLLLKILFESIATPQEADLNDEPIRALLASPRHLPEQDASAERSQVCHSEKEGLMSSSSQGLNVIGTGRPVALFSHQSQLNQDAFSERRNLLMF